VAISGDPLVGQSPSLIPESKEATSAEPEQQIIFAVLEINFRHSHVLPKDWLWLCF
jgi:hypothetical protein